MAAFCAAFPWCTPGRFWLLELDEYVALRDLLDRLQEAR